MAASGLKSEAGAPGTEITPAMVEAGKREVMRYDPDYDAPEDVAARVYEAMVEASRAS